MRTSVSPTSKKTILGGIIGGPVMRASDGSCASEPRFLSRPIAAQELEGVAAVAPAHHRDALVLEELVRLEEVLDLAGQVRRHLVEGLDVLEERIGHRHAQDLVVRALVVGHGQTADRTAPNMA